MQSARTAEQDTRSRVLPMVGLLARLGLGAVMIYAGATKVVDLTGSIQTVLAYQLLGYEASRVVGVLLPIVELALGALLASGLLTRPAAAVTGVLMLVFMVGIASAWARGLSIDCGCFGTGGAVDPSQTAYPAALLRDAFFLAMALWLVVQPRTPFSLDSLIAERSPA